MATIGRRQMRVHRRQLHVWISDADYDFLVRHAEQRDETIGLLVRRLIRRLKHESANPQDTGTRNPSESRSIDSPGK
jgi:hypothetical protein